ncbi:MAG TPA: HAD family hydrolase [Gemmatimonadaceae bacterium]|nr:HAD family hydrolase [Gemmatimonadaceae bacterium]
MTRALNDFEVVSFDCFGTLIDWETGIAAALAPWLARHSLARSRDAVLARFAAHETDIESRDPELRYPRVLENVLRRMAADWRVDCTDAEAREFGASVVSWPPFPDTAAALTYLQRHYRLAALSNVDVQSASTTVKKLGIEFELVITAEEVGSYKPDLRNFEYLLASLAKRGVQAGGVLHTAQSLFHDVAPAKRLNLATNWIDRRANAPGWGATPPPRQPVVPDFRHESLAEFVAHHRTLLG